MSSEPQIRYTKTSDGVNIAYLRTGEGPVLVDVASGPYMDVQRMWQAPVGGASFKRFARGKTWIGYDNRGSGMSDRNATEFSLETDLLDLEAVLDRVEAPSVSLLAALSAGPIAITYAARHPERVDRLVLLGAWARFNTEFLALMPLMSSNYRLFTDTLARMVMGFDTGEAAREFAETMRSCVSRETAAAIINAHAGDDVRDLLPKIMVPALILDLEGDGFGGLSESSRYLAANLPNAHLFRAGADWGVTVDTGAGGDAFYRAIDEFICGVPVGAAATIIPNGLGALAAEPSAPSAMAVILFTDIVASTELTERMGDARFRDASRALDAGLRAAIRDAGGAAIDGKLLGDGVLATFPSAAQAIDGAQRCLELSAASELGLHIGLHAGDVIREDNNVYGGAVNIASRICGISAAGEILVSDVVRGMARSSAGVEFEDRGEQEMKGVGEPVRVYAVRGAE